MIACGTLSSLRPRRDPMSRARGWSQRTTPVVCVPAPISETVKPAVRAKVPPLVIGSTTGVRVNRLNAVGEAIEISNQCARLIANAIIYYNSAILSRLLTKHEVAGNAKALELITQMSPAAWRHILLNGHYTFQSDGKMIDLDALVAELELG